MKVGAPLIPLNQVEVESINWTHSCQIDDPICALHMAVMGHFLPYQGEEMSRRATTERSGRLCLFFADLISRLIASTCSQTLSSWRSTRPN